MSQTGERNAASRLEHPERFTQRDVRVGKVTHAKSADDCVERLRIERKSLCVPLLESHAGIPVARHLHLYCGKVDPDDISPALCSGAGNVTRARCDIQYARSAADARSIKQCLYRLCRYAGYVLVVLGDDAGALPSSLLKFSECLTGASHRNSKCAPRSVHCNRF